MHFKLLIGTVVSAVGLSSASAITTVAGYSFQDNAFADSVLASSGTYTLAGAASLSAAVTGSSLTKYAFSSSTGAALDGANIQLGFTDNYLVNGAGFDLALFEYGTASTFAVTIGGITHNYLTSGTGFTTSIGGPTLQVNVAQINLDDFGAASGAQFSSILIGMGILPNLPTLGVVGALNSTPVQTQAVPDAGSTLSMLGAALAGLGLLKRKF